MPESTFSFKKLFPLRNESPPTDDALSRLADAMTDTKQRTEAGYTYLGQFIDHDITLELTHDGKPRPPWYPISETEVINGRTPFLNLETLYGFESKPHLPRSTWFREGSKALLKLGETEGNGEIRSFPEKDLQRGPDGMAIIVDARNDENLPVAQTQVAFTRFHNAIVQRFFMDKNQLDEDAAFEEAKALVTKYYQWIVLKDYLPKVVKKEVLEEVEAKNTFYTPDPQDVFMPLEFSVAAFRMGHSMIRDRYNWNKIFNDDPFPVASPASLQQLRRFTGRGGLGGRKKLVSHWLINWNWFYEDTSINEQHQKLNRVTIDTNIARDLGRLPNRYGCIPEGFERDRSLPALDLYRARAFDLPSGQAIARFIYPKRDGLQPEQIANLLPVELRSDFSKETPLWFYLLAEAEIEEKGYTLGEIGSRIVAEVLVGLIRLSEPSILKPPYFKPDPELCDSKGHFGMSDLLKFVRRMERDQYALNPLEPINLTRKTVRVEVQNFISQLQK